MPSLVPRDGQTIAEYIFSAKVGRRVRAGDVVEVAADVVCFPDLGMHMFRKAWEPLGVNRVADPDRVAVVFDHRVPTDSQSTSAMHRYWRKWCADHGVTKLGDLGTQGISHQWLVERGYARPGMLVTNLDTHANTTGGVGCFATAVGFGIVMDLALGVNWHIVPETVRVSLSGSLNAGVLTRDVMHAVNNSLGQDGGIGKAIEFHGPAVSGMTIDQRMTLCNLTRKVEAMTGLCASDETTQRWYRDRGLGDVDQLASDPDATYEREVSVNLESVELSVSPPPSAAVAVPLSQVVGTHIDQAFIGSCAGGRLDDLRAGAAVLRGRKVALGVRLVVAPASQDIYQAALADGTIADLAASGAILAPASCGACMGAPYGALDDGEICIATATENYPGRMGSPSAKTFLASAAIVAASAIEGCIADPRPFLVS